MESVPNYGNTLNAEIPGPAKLRLVIGHNIRLIKQVDTEQQQVATLQTIIRQLRAQAGRDEETIDALREKLQERNTEVQTLQNRLQEKHGNKYMRRLENQQVLLDQIEELKRLNSELIQQRNL